MRSIVAMRRGQQYLHVFSIVPMNRLNQTETAIRACNIFIFVVLYLVAFEFLFFTSILLKIKLLQSYFKQPNIHHWMSQLKSRIDNVYSRNKHQKQLYFLIYCIHTAILPLYFACLSDKVVMKILTWSYISEMANYMWTFAAASSNSRRIFDYENKEYWNTCVTQDIQNCWKNVKHHTQASNYG